MMLHRTGWRSRLQDACPHLTAEAIYNFLLERQYPADVLAELTRLFARDSHALWYAAPHPGSRPAASGQLLPTGEEDADDETELRKADTRDETLQQAAAAAEGNPAQTMEAAGPPGQDRSGDLQPPSRQTCRSIDGWVRARDL